MAARKQAPAAPLSTALTEDPVKLLELAHILADHGAFATAINLAGLAIVRLRAEMTLREKLMAAATGEPAKGKR